MLFSFLCFFHRKCQIFFLELLFKLKNLLRLLSNSNVYFSSYLKKSFLINWIKTSIKAGKKLHNSNYHPLLFHSYICANHAIQKHKFILFVLVSIKTVKLPSCTKNKFPYDKNCFATTNNIISKSI